QPPRNTPATNGGQPPWCRRGTILVGSCYRFQQPGAVGDDGVTLHLSLSDQLPFVVVGQTGVDVSLGVTNRRDSIGLAGERGFLLLRCRAPTFTGGPNL